jgi:hypothetical protein
MNDFESRLERAFVQRIYLMRMTHPTEREFDFMVMGASGLPYNIKIRQGSFISCSCPDHEKNHKLCKHLLFVLIRVLKESRTNVRNSYFAQGLFVTTSSTFEKCLHYSNSIDNIEVSSIDSSLNGLDGLDGLVSQRETTDESCPICFEDFTNSEDLVYCKTSCGKSVHTDCFVKWAKVRTATCVYCRSKWVW